jgi:hypothetical protein
LDWEEHEAVRVRGEQELGLHVTLELFALELGGERLRAQLALGRAGGGLAAACGRGLGRQVRVAVAEHFVAQHLLLNVFAFQHVGHL